MYVQVGEVGFFQVSITFSPTMPLASLPSVHLALPPTMPHAFLPSPHLALFLR